MAGNTEGGKLAAQKNKELYGENFYKEIAAIGGRKKNPLKGFGSNRDLARTAGEKGGRISRRTAKVAA